MITIEELSHRWQSINETVRKTALKFGRNPDNIKIISVSKTHPPEVLINAIKAGINIFGENYVQELKDKQKYISETMTYEPEWHFIGHLQTNKVKFIAPFIHTIHSVDSVKLAEEISKHSINFGRTINILIQVNTSGEASKSGCEPENTLQLVNDIKNLDNLNLIGLMTIGTFSSDEIIIRREFKILSSLLNTINSSIEGVKLKHLSMGMSHDFQIAIEEGATFIRIGTAIFGERY